MTVAARIRLLAGIALVVVPTLVFGKVFLRWGGWPGDSSLRSDLLGKTAYKASVNINGGRGDLAVVASDSDIGATVARLKQVYGSSGQPPVVIGGRSMAFGIATRQGKVVRMLAVSLERRTGCMVFLLEQSQGEFEQSAKRPDRHMLAGLPSYPGSETTFFFRNDDTRTAVETAASASPPAAVADFFESSLGRDGWTPALPGKASGSRSTGIFLRGSDICCIAVRPADESAGSLITMLQKQGAMK